MSKRGTHKTNGHFHDPQLNKFLMRKYSQRNQQRLYVSKKFHGPKRTVKTNPRRNRNRRTMSEPQDLA